MKIDCKACGGTVDGPTNKQIRNWRLAHSLTIPQAARRLGISKVYLGFIEQGRRPVTAPVARKFYEAQAQL